MFGVVLWSNEQDQKAVIWCEDHGDLAYFRNTDETNRIAFDAGDWVQFDMTMERCQRFAHNPILVHEGVYPDLADALCAVPVGKPDLVGLKHSDRDSAQIIPFATTHDRTTRNYQKAGPASANQA